MPENAGALSTEAVSNRLLIVSLSDCSFLQAAASTAQMFMIVMVLSSQNKDRPEHKVFV